MIKPYHLFFAFIISSHSKVWQLNESLLSMLSDYIQISHLSVHIPFFDKYSIHTLAFYGVEYVYPSQHKNGLQALDSCVLEIA